MINLRLNGEEKEYAAPSQLWLGVGGRARNMRRSLPPKLQTESSPKPARCTAKRRVKLASENIFVT